MTENLKEQTGAHGVKTQLQLGTMHGQGIVPTTVVSDLVVADIEDKNPIEISRSYTRMEIPMSEEQIPTPDMMGPWEHLRSVAQKNATVHTKHRNKFADW